MIYKATMLIQQEMDKKELKYYVEEFDDRSILYAGFGIENGPSVRVQFISRDNDNDVAIFLFGLVNGVSEDNMDKMLNAINECNKKYRYLKFYVDDDRNVNVEYDIPIEADDNSVGAEACEIFVRFMQITNECYPMLMKVIWS
ncbi:YbjN domain-containing protein [Zhenpiania hominis]|uniref:YbjN domain-containing protein n=1 Tax=Zhenpiania hominis TaxID=2763644 RepID=UPI0039F55E16